jgi:hypothetical protein
MPVQRTGWHCFSQRNDSTMPHLKFGGLITPFLRSRKSTYKKNVIVVLCLAIAVIALASCGSVATGQARQATPTAIPTHAPTTTPTPRPSPKPTVAPQPTQPPPAPAPAILDLRPLSMSIVGHLDCTKNGAFVCLARVLSRPDAQSNLHWVAFTNVPGHIAFSPSSGVLAPGQSVLVTITVPLTACTPGLFFFQGPVNTHTITWAC